MSPLSTPRSFAVQPSASPASVKTLLMAGGALAVLASAALPAHAQMLEEIVVTAQKREESIQKIGVSVTAFSGDGIKEFGFTNSVDIAAQVPGLNIGTPVGEGNNPSFTLRGVGLNDFNDNNEGPIAIYTDETYMAAMPGLTFQLFDVERVEVLRGPQGTLYGRNATGGLLHFISRKPTDTVEGYGTLEGGSHTTINFEGAVGGPISDTVRARLSAAINSYDGYVENRVGKDGNEADSYAVRGQMEFDIGSSASLLLRANYGRSDVLSPNYQHQATNPVGAFPFCAADVARDNYCYADTDDDNFAGDYDRQGSLDIEAWGTSATFNMDFDGIELTNILSYAKTDKSHEEDSDMGPYPAVEPTFTSNIRQISNEFRLSGGQERLNWVTGVYYIDTKVKSANDLSIQWRGDFAAFLDGLSLEDGGFDGLLSAASPDVVLGGTNLVPAILFDADYVQDMSSYAGFGQVDYDLADRLTLTVGVRYSHEKKTLEYFNGIGGNALLNNAFRDILGTSAWFDFTTGSTGSGPVLDHGPVGDLNRVKSNTWTGKLGLAYEVTDDLLVYASWNRGAKSGGFNAGLLDVSDGLLAVDVPYKEEILTSYEAGFKYSNPEGTFRMNATGFYYDYKDFQALSFSGLSQFISNADATFYGAELEVGASPVERIDMQVGMSFLDTDVDGVVDRNSGAIIDNTKAVLAPEFTANGFVRYRHPLKAGELSAMVSFNHQGSHYFDITNKAVSRQGAYTLFDLRVAYTNPEDTYELAFTVKNLTDKEYRVYTFDLSDAAGLNQNFYGHPRWFLASLTARF